MKRFIRSIDTLSGWIGGLAGVLLCLGLALVAAEIVLRTAFSRTLYVTDEYSGYLMCGLTFCGLAYTLRERGHIRMSLVHGIVKGRPRHLLDLICCLVGMIFALVLGWYTGHSFWDSLVTGAQSMQISATYLAIPQSFLPLGALMLALQFLAEGLKTLLVLRGETDGLVLLEEAKDLGR